MVLTVEMQESFRVISFRLSRQLNSIWRNTRRLVPNMVSIGSLMILRRIATAANRNFITCSASLSAGGTIAASVASSFVASA